jgi:hypothetical protein
MLLDKVVFLNSIRIALDHKRSILQEGKHIRRNLCIISDNLSLRDAFIGPEHFAKIAQLEVAAINTDDPIVAQD